MNGSDTINITDLAIINILRLQKEYDQENYGLRFGLTGGGCSGYKYVLEFEEKAKKEDMIFQYSGVKIFVNISHIIKLKNSTIDWKESLMEAGFDIINPQAKRPCGCGESIDFTS